MLTILVDRGLMWHISFLFNVFRLTLDRFMCCVHVTITDVSNLFPDFRSIYAVRFDFDLIHYKQSACLLFNKETPKDMARKSQVFFADVITQK